MILAHLFSWVEISQDTKYLIKLQSGEFNQAYISIFYLISCPVYSLG